MSHNHKLLSAYLQQKVKIIISWSLHIEPFYVKNIPTKIVGFVLELYNATKKPVWV